MQKPHGMTLAAMASLVGVAGVASGQQTIHPDAYTRLSSDFANNTLVVHWGADANDIIRNAALSAVDGSVVATDEDGSQILSVGVGTSQARALLGQFPSTIISSLESTSVFINNQFGVDSHMLEVLTVQPINDQTILVPVVLDGGIYTLELVRASVRSNEFKLFVEGEDGSLVEIDAPASNTYRGRVLEMPGSDIAATIDDTGMTATIILDNDIDAGWFIQPLNDIVDGAPSDVHVVYDSEASIATDAICGGALINNNTLIGVDPQEHFNARGLITAEIAFDADFQFFQINGSNTTTTTNDINNILNAVNVIYERDTGVTFVITQIIIRTSSGSNPYTTNDAGALLDQFRNQWLGNHGSVHRDLAHLMTGRNLDGSTIGVAWLSAVCTNFGFGLSQSRFTTNFNQRVALTAHEMGHNFSANHCSGSSCKIMCAGLGGCGGIGLPNFSSGSASSISNFAASRGCLDNGPPPNTGPTLQITTPFNNQMVDEGTAIFFTVFADDAEDGDISNSTSWVSSIDGFMFIGSGVSYANLSAGTHTITATVFDSGGLNDTDQVTVIVNATGGVTPPAKPDRPTTQDLGNGTARINWTDLPNEDEWDVQREEKISGSWTNRTTVASGLPANTVSYDDAAGFGTFRYRIRARNSAGNSPWSAWRGRNLVDASPPSAPTGFDAVDLGGGQAQLTWTDTSDSETKFQIQRQEKVGGSWTNTSLIAQPGANTESYTDTPGAGVFRYRVRARNNAGASGWTSWGDGKVTVTP